MNCAQDVVDHSEGVQLGQLPPLTTLLVRTMNSLYRVVIVEATDVCVQGGEFFRNPERASLDGSITERRCLKVGWIGVGRMMEIRSEGRRITTSPVRGIVIEPPLHDIVH
ncbi:MAG TPA: hypothetical protein VFB85_10125 [Vicinamibacterales bacterium]|nr:hypothetical protein [Vicinamibacterales bacterium]